MERLFNHFVRLYLVTSMWFFWPGMMAYKPQELFIQYGAFILIGFSLFVKPVRQIDNKWLAILFFYMIVNTLVFRWDSTTRMALMNVCLGLVSVKIISERFDLNLKAIGTILLLFICANLMLLVLQVKNVDPIYANVHLENMVEVDHVGFMGARYALGCLAALAIPFVFGLSPAWCLLTLPLLYFGKSSTCVVVSAVVFSFLLYTKIDGFERVKKWLFWLFVVGVIGGLYYYVVHMDMPTGQFQKRLYVWHAGIRASVGSKPYLGSGLGSWSLANFTTIQQNGQPEKWLWAHNEFIQFLFEQGIIGLGLLLILLKDYFKRLLVDVRANAVPIACLLSVIGLSVFHFPFHARFVGFVIVIFAYLEAHLTEASNEI